MDDIKKDLIEKLKKSKINLPKKYSGSFNIRASKELHQLLAMEALEQNISLNSFINNILKLWFLK